jgi:hypothetical protein
MNGWGLGDCASELLDARLDPRTAQTQHVQHLGLERPDGVMRGHATGADQMRKV